MKLTFTIICTILCMNSLISQNSTIVHINDNDTNEDVSLIIEADPTDDAFTENINPRLEFWQDGGYSNSSIGLNLFDNEAHNGLYIANTTAAFGGIHLATDNTSGGWSTAKVRFIVSTNGNVGVGATQPESIFHITDDNSDAALIIEADPNDIQGNENINPRIEFVQDGGYSNSSIGLNLLEDGTDNGLFIANTTSANGGIHLATDDSAFGWTASEIRMTVATNGNVGIGVTIPKAKLQVTDGDVYIEDVNKGVIMKSPNGQCWRYTPDNTGQLNPVAISCPN